MSNDIQFLATLGRSPSLSSADYQSAVDALDLDGEQRRALLHRDSRALNSLLQGRAAMRCAVFSPPEG